MKVIALYGVSSLSMLEESSDNKQRIQNAVQKGIKLGIVRPFDRRILTGPYTKNLALEALKYTYIFYSTFAFCKQLLYLLLYT